MAPFKWIVFASWSLTGLPALRWMLGGSWDTFGSYLPPPLPQFIDQLPIAWCEWYVMPWAAAWGTFFFVHLFVNQSIGAARLGKDHHGFESTDDEAVPHLRNRRTEDGFKVAVSDGDALAPGLFILMLTLLILGVWRYWFAKTITTGMVLTALIGTALAYFRALRRPTSIEFSRQKIVVTDQRNGTKKLDRTKFNSFTILHPNFLAYSYGKRRQSFGCCLPRIHVEEIAAQLNRLLDTLPPSEEPVPNPHPVRSSPVQRSKY